VSSRHARSAGGSWAAAWRDARARPLPRRLLARWAVWLVWALAVVNGIVLGPLRGVPWPVTAGLALTLVAGFTLGLAWPGR